MNLYRICLDFRSERAGAERAFHETAAFLAAQPAVEQVRVVMQAVEMPGPNGEEPP